MRRKWYSLKSLVGIALQYQNREVDQNRYWSLINRLHAWGTPEIVLLGKKLYQSHNWHKRLLAVEIYNQLSSFDALGRYVPYAVEASQLILCQALHENRVEIIQSAICGLGHRPTALAFLLPAIVM